VIGATVAGIATTVDVAGTSPVVVALFGAGTVRHLACWVVSHGPR
jgi:hypothetical protein